jgi:hypothetical protein
MNSVSQCGEPSIADQCQVDLYFALCKARKEESFLPLSVIAEMLHECLDADEHQLLADYLYMYDESTTFAEEHSF